MKLQAFISIIPIFSNLLLLVNFVGAKVLFSGSHRHYGLLNYHNSYE